MKWMIFYEWMTQKFLDWQKEEGERKTVTEFAKYLGVGQQTVSTWLQPKGSVPKSTASINKLAAIYGSEVYQVLGLETPSSLSLADIPEELQADLEHALKEANQVYRSLNQHGQRLPEAQAKRILTDILAKYGFVETASSSEIEKS